MNKNEINKLLKKINNNYSRLNDYCKTNFKLIHNEIENLKLFTKSKPKKTKQALNFFVSLLKNILIISLFSLPFSTQLETMINNKNYMLEYNISNYSLQSSMQNYEFSLLPGKENLYQHCFTLNADCYIYEGSLKNIFLIYSKDENNKFSEFDFKELKLTNKTTAFHKLFYLLSSIKILHYMWPKLKNTYNQKLDFTAKISYGSSTKKKTKNFYLLAIDKQNNISINIFTSNNYCKCICC